MTLKEIFYKLCSNYGWTIEYVASLKIKQITTLMEAEVKYKNRLVGNKQENNDNNIGSVDDMINSGMIAKGKK